MKTKTTLFAVASLAFADAIYLAVSFSFTNVCALLVAVTGFGLICAVAGVVVDLEDDRKTVYNTVRVLRKMGLRKLAYKYANLGK